MKIVTKIAMFVLALLIIVMPAVACGKPTPPPAPSPPAPSPPPVAPKKITLADAPMVLDLSPLLPTSFERVDAASEGMSNKDMGLGPKASEVELFLSEEPYQLIYCFLMITESRIERATSDAVFKDEQQIESLLIENLKAGALEEGFELQVPEVQITYPNIADLAVLGESYIITSGMTFGFDILWFRSNKVYVFTYSLYLSAEKQSLVPITREINHRVSMFSQ